MAKMKPGGQAVIGLLVIAAFICAKLFWWDKRPHDVQESKSFGTVAIPDAPGASLSGTAAIKLDLASNEPIGADGTRVNVNWYQMAWQAQSSINGSNGGAVTTKGSLFDKSGLFVTIIRKDDCSQSCAEFVKFCKAYKDDPHTPAAFLTFMGSGVPAFIYSLTQATKDLGPEYAPVAFMVSGKSYGEDQIIGDKKYKDNKQNLKGAVCVGVRMDGDQDLMLKLAGDNNIKVNSDDKTYDPDAINLMYPADFLDAVVKYNAGFKETRHIVRNGKTTGKDTTVSPDLVATWTPGDVNAHAGKGGVTIISTKEYASIMPAVTITCKKWLADHGAAAAEIIKDCAIEGDQIRSFEDVKKHVCGLNAAIYNEKDETYWYNYFNGSKVDNDTHLGGSAVFNLADMANELGVPTAGNTNTNDIYRAIYNTFGTLQSKYYPKDLPSYIDYSKAFDKTATITVISGNPDLLQGKVSKTDYAAIATTGTSAAAKVGNKIYHINFVTGSATLDESSNTVLDGIYQDAVAADGTKLAINGYTDNVGSPEKNVTLSQARADAVKSYLIGKGLTADRLVSTGYGADGNIAPNETSEGRARNRRVEISLYSAQ